MTRAPEATAALPGAIAAPREASAVLREARISRRGRKKKKKKGWGKRKSSRREIWRKKVITRTWRMGVKKE